MQLDNEKLHVLCYVTLGADTSITNSRTNAKNIVLQLGISCEHITLKVIIFIHS